MDALNTVFLHLCFASSVCYFLLPYPGMFLFFVFLRLYSSHLLLSASSTCSFFLSFVSCLISEFLVFTCLGQQLGDRKTENKTGFLLRGVETHTSLRFLSSYSTGAEKNVLFAHSTSPLPRVLASQDTGHHQTWRAYAPLS